MYFQVPDQYGTIRAVSEGKGDEFLVGTSRNFILRGTFNDGFLVLVQVRLHDILLISSQRFSLGQQDFLEDVGGVSLKNLPPCGVIKSTGTCTAVN